MRETHPYQDATLALARRPKPPSDEQLLRIITRPIAILGYKKSEGLLAPLIGFAPFSIGYLVAQLLELFINSPETWILITFASTAILMVICYISCIVLIQKRERLQHKDVNYANNSIFSQRDPP